MAEQDSGQERTEDPTGKRLQDARDKGQVPRSQELSTVVVLVASAVGMLFVGGNLISSLGEVMTQSFSLNRKLIMDPHMMAQQLIFALKIMALDVLTFLAITLIAALSAPALIGGWNFSAQAMGVKLEKMSPLRGLKRIFGPQGLVELGKALGKFLLVGSIGTLILWSLRDRLLTLGRQEVQIAMTELGYIVLWGFLAICASLILIALIDV
ncbi:MAG TPA: flagellar biosynthetic protein FlhB, partial [Methylophaga sp.]|nr:flagellar biosynthetic protein FlhB [Methylophaga sp.]